MNKTAIIPTPPPPGGVDLKIKGAPKIRHEPGLYYNLC